MSSTSLSDIERLTKSYADARDDLGRQVTRLNFSIEAIKRDNLPAIKKLVNRAAEREASLRAAIEGAPGLFVQPRTVIFHGIKCGYRKGSGGIAWDDDDKVVELIEKLFKDQEQRDLLIKTTKRPIKKALQQLDVADLKKIGCTVEETGDQVFVKAVDSAVDKLVNALLKDAVEEANEEAA